MIHICELDVPRQKLLECPPCTEFFFERISPVEFVIRQKRIPITVVRRYLLRTCYLGLGVGQHVYSMTMLPGEETEIEIVRRSKFSRALHEQRSVESEFRFELQNTARDEWSSEEESNFEVSAEAGFKIFGIGAKTRGKYAGRERNAEEHFREVISKSSSKVSQKYEIAIDTKTEVENQYRSVRKIKNPNPCQPVIYNYFQLAKKFRSELILTDLRFDFPVTLPRILSDRLKTFVIAAESTYRQDINLQVVAPPPLWTLSSAAGVQATADFASLARFRGTAASGRLADLAGLPAVQVAAEPPEILQLTRDELFDKVAERINDRRVVALFRREFGRFLRDDINRLGVHQTYEYCINTDGLYVEANASKCSPCDEPTLKLRELEVEKLKAEIELLKCQAEGGDATARDDV